MGYELIFHFQEEIEKGKYGDEVLTRKVRVGKANDDIPLEAAAAKIFAQLARRNILVTDVEIYEYTKKKLNYREVDDGFMIKNKKFKFDDGPTAMVSEESPEESSNPRDQLAALLAANPDLLGQIIQQQGGASPPRRPNVTAPQPRAPVNLGRALREEVFDPPAFLRDEIAKRGLPFTRGQKYPIYDEKPNPNAQAGMDYVTVDDAGQKRTINSIHFNLPGKLDGPFENQGPPAGEEPTLAWDGVDDKFGVPDLRG